VTSVPMFPDMKSDKNDKWDAFPEQRQQILDFIHSNRIRKVVFVSGDVHCSFTSELRLEGDDDFLVHQIVSSSFFWPLPHMRQSSFGFGEALKGKGNQRYVGALTSEMHSKDNFARIEVDQTSVVVSFYERKGDALGSVTLVF
jgi:alkaline phosphatase D